MMIIYHFKQRITVIEKKTETTIEILNNLAKETTALRGIVMNLIRASHGPPMFEQFLTQPDFNSPPQPMDNDFKDIQTEVNNITIDLNEDNVKVKHFDISEISNLHIIQDNDTESESDMDEESESEESESEDENDDKESEDGADADAEKKEENLDMFEKVVVLPDAEIETEVIENETTQIQRIEDYSKFTTSQLKNIVLDKKLYAGNVNKLKRTDLLKLLQ